MNSSQKEGLRSISKQAIKKALGGRNKAKLCPGKDALPVLPTCQPPFTFDREPLVRYENTESEEQNDATAGSGRRLSVELAALSADRAFRLLAEGNEAKEARALEQFKKLFGALHRGGLLYKALSKKPALSIGKEALFDSRRQEIVNVAIRTETEAREASARSSKETEDHKAEDEGEEDEDEDVVHVGA